MERINIGGTEQGETLSLLKEQLTKIKLLQNELAIRNQQVDILKEQVSELESQKNDKDETTKRFERNLKGKEEEYSMKIQSLQEKNEGLGIFSQQLIERVKELNQQSSTMEKEMIALKNQFNSMVQERQILVEEVEDSKSFCMELEQKASESRASTLMALGENQAMNQQIDTIREELEIQRQEIDNQNERIESQLQDIEKKNNKIDGLEKKMLKKEEKVAQLEEECKKFEKKIAENTRLGVENSQLRVETASLRQKQEENFKLIQDMKQNITKQEDAIEKLNREEKQNKKSMLEAKKKNEVIGQENLNLREQLVELKEEMNMMSQTKSRELKMCLDLVEDKINLFSVDKKNITKPSKNMIPKSKTKEAIKSFQNAIITSHLNTNQDLTDRSQQSDKDEDSTLLIEKLKSKIIGLSEICEQYKQRAGETEQKQFEMIDRISRLQQEADQLSQMNEISQVEQENDMLSQQSQYQEQIMKLKDLYDKKLESLEGKSNQDELLIQQIDSKLQQAISENKELSNQLLHSQKEISSQQSVLQIAKSALVIMSDSLASIWNEFVEIKHTKEFLKKYFAYHVTLSSVIKQAECKKKSSYDSNAKNNSLNESTNSLFSQQIKKEAKSFRKYALAVLFICKQIKSVKSRKIIEPNSNEKCLSWLNKKLLKTISTSIASENQVKLQELQSQYCWSSPATLISHLLHKCTQLDSLSIFRTGETAFKAKTSKDVQKIASLIRENDSFQHELASMTKRVLGLGEQTKQIESQLMKQIEEKYLFQIQEKDNLISQLTSTNSSYKKINQLEINLEDAKTHWSSDGKEKLSQQKESNTQSLISQPQSNIEHLSVDSLQQELSQIINAKKDYAKNFQTFSNNSSSIAYSLSSLQQSQSSIPQSLHSGFSQLTENYTQPQVKKALGPKCAGKIIRNTPKVQE